MEEKGYLIAQVFTARMAIPIEGVSVSILTDDDEDPELIAFRKTDRNGKTEPVEIPTPSVDATLEPSSERGFSTCNIQLEHTGYYSVLVEHVQIFSGVESIQQMEMVPAAEFVEPEDWSRIYAITPQDL